jgi:chemotaxis receptor (MCP) glutamine deamidase CheD
MSTEDTEVKTEGTQSQDSIKIIEDSDEMIYVKMDTFGVTSATNEHPFLKTVGVAFCVGVALWDPNSKVAGMLHITPSSIDRSGTQKPNQDIANVLEAMQRHGLDPKNVSQLQAHVLSFQGTNNGDIVVKKLSELGINNTTNYRSENSVNFAIDARNGEIFHLTNLKPLPSQARYGEIRPSGGAQLTSDSRSLR